MPDASNHSRYARRIFQSDALDANVALADLPRLSHPDLVRLGQEVRLSLQLLDAELQMEGRQGQSASQGVMADIHRAMIDLKHYLSFFEERVMYHRMRRRREGQHSPVGERTAGLHDVA